MKSKGYVFAVLVSLFFLSGCATTQRESDLTAQGLRNQISVLETQLKSKDEEAGSLRDELNKAIQEKEAQAQAKEKAGSKKVIAEVKSRPNVKQIQVALRNAGYNPGAIDAKLGRQTKDALKAFQKANGLKADGKAGKQTWSLLRKYLYQKVK